VLTNLEKPGISANKSGVIWCICTLSSAKCRHRRHRWRRRRDMAETVIASKPLLATVNTPSNPLPLNLAPPPSPAPPLRLASSAALSPSVSPTPAKRTRKAVKLHCEVELLRGGPEDLELQLSPLACTPTSPSPSPLTPCTPPRPPSPSSPTFGPLSLSSSLSTLMQETPPRPASQIPATPPTASPESTPTQTTPPQLTTPMPTTLPTASPVAQPAQSSTPSFRAPPTPPPIGKLPTSWRKVLCRECHRDSHNISYRHCIECHFKENGYPFYYHDMQQCACYVRISCASFSLLR
jgi:hypothetical protein